jgi:hypothetical protein
MDGLELLQMSRFAIPQVLHDFFHAPFWRSRFWRCLVIFNKCMALLGVVLALTLWVLLQALSEF